MTHFQREINDIRMLDRDEVMYLPENEYIDWLRRRKRCCLIEALRKMAMTFGIQNDDCNNLPVENN